MRGREGGRERGRRGRERGREREEGREGEEVSTHLLHHTSGVIVTDLSVMCLFLRAEEKDEKAEVQVGRRYIAFTVAVKLTESLRCCSSASRRPEKEEEEK